VDYTTERHLTILCHQLFDANSSTSLASLAGKNTILFMKFLASIDKVMFNYSSAI
jgi:hypothetical protein